MKTRLIIASVLLFFIAATAGFGCKKSTSPPKEGEPAPPTIPMPLPPPPEATTPTVRAVTSTSFSSGATVTVNQPPGTIAGDLLILVMAKDGSSAAKPSNEEGWVRIVSDRYGSGTPLIRAWWKQVSENDPPSYTFNIGSTSNAGRVDLICVKDWNGSAPTATYATVNHLSTFTSPSAPAISTTGNDLLINTVAVAAASGLQGVSWSNSSVGFTTHSNLSTSKVTMATSSKTEQTVNTPNLITGNTFTATGIDISRASALISFVVPSYSTRKIIRVYRGGAALSGGAYASHENLVDILTKPSLFYDVRSVGENEVDKISADVLKSASLYVQPGGPTIQVGWPYVAPFKATIREYMDNGGKYLGVCLGAYFFRNAVNGGFELLPQGNFAYTYSSLAGTTYNGDGAGLVQLNLKDNWGAGLRNVTIVGGCYFNTRNGIPDLTHLATFDQPNKNEPSAAIRFSFNPSNDNTKGWVIGIGPHPEATSWGVTDPDGSDPDLIEKSVADLLSR